MELTAEKQNQLYIPGGFTHGFLTLTPDVVIADKVSAPYSRPHDRSLNWADESLGIHWQLPKDAKPILSEKDEKAPLLSALKHDLVEFS